MTLPSLPVPTDNLYKFCAIAGLVLLLFGATFPTLKIFETQDELNQVETESKILHQNSLNLKEDTQHLLSKVNKIGDDTAEATAHSRDPDMQTLHARTIEASKELEKIRASSRKQLIESIKLRGRQDHIVTLTHRLWIYIFIEALFMFGGFLLAHFGFVRWYVLLQQPTDVLLARRATEARDKTTD